MKWYRLPLYRYMARRAAVDQTPSATQNNTIQWAYVSTDIHEWDYCCCSAIFYLSFPFVWQIWIIEKSRFFNSLAVDILKYSWDVLKCYIDVIMSVSIILAAYLSGTSNVLQVSEWLGSAQIRLQCRNASPRRLDTKIHSHSMYETLNLGCTGHTQKCS